LKLVNSTSSNQTVSVKLEGVKKLATKGKQIVLKSDDLNRVNSLDQPLFVSPVEQEVEIKGKMVKQVLQPYSFTVIKIKQIK